MSDQVIFWYVLGSYTLGGVVSWLTFGRSRCVRQYEQLRILVAQWRIAAVDDPNVRRAQVFNQAAQELENLLEDRGRDR